MVIAVLGSTGNVGSEVVRQALERGDSVFAYARPSSVGRLPDHPRLSVRIGELDHPESLRECIAGSDAVISALGSRDNSPEGAEVFDNAMKLVTSLMQEEGVRRLVAISGAGTRLEGDPWRFSRTLIRGLMKIAARHLLAAKQQEAAVIQATDLEWVIVRPTRIMDGTPTGRLAASLEEPPSHTVSRGDVAAFMLQATSDDTWVHAAPYIGTLQEGAQP